jgi:glycosyltransferase involved in cell wall biosynthesis
MFVAVSHYIRRKAIDAGFPEDKIRVLYNGIDRATFHPSDEPTDNDLIVYVGRLVEYKGAAYLLRAMQIIQQKRPSAKLVLIGEGVMRSSFERLAHSLGVRCQFLGHQPATVVRSWLQRARVFCAPSLTLPDGQSEAFGIVFIEAQSMGVPCVSFRNAGVEEAILHGETGLLAPERDYEALAQHLIRYMEDDAFWRVSRERGIERVRKYFDVNIQSRTLEDLYEEVIAGATSTESWHRQKTLTAVATHAPSQSASPYQMPELQKGRRRSN